MPKKIPYPSSKVKEWERDRRERLNISFRELGSLLPSYNPASALSKIEILQGAVKYIKDLHNENKTLLEKGLNKSTAKQLNQLRKRVDELSRRAQQLANLLREAGITIPNVLPDTDEVIPKQPLKWDNKTKNSSALHEKAKKKKAELKEKKMDSKTQQIDSSSINTVKSASTDIKRSKCSKKNICKAVDTSLNTSINPSNLEEKFSKKCKSSKKMRKKRQTIVQQAQLIANCLRAASAANSESEKGAAINSCHDGARRLTQTTTSVTSVAQSCFVMSVTPQITTMPSSSPQQISIVLPNGAGGIGVTKTVNEAITKSHLLTAPIMAASIQTCPPATVITNTGLGAGTLILANGNIVPVLPSPQFHLSTLHNSSVIMLQKNLLNTISTSAYLALNKPQKGFTPLISKPIRRSMVDSTVTTFSNKVPIPALTVRHHQPQIISTSVAESKTIINKAKTRLKLSKLNRVSIVPQKEIDSKRLTREKENLTGINKTKQVLNLQENELEEVNNLNCTIKLNTENSDDCVTTSKYSYIKNVVDVQDNVTETNCNHIPVTDSNDIGTTNALNKENVRRQASKLCDKQNVDMLEKESATKYILDKHKDNKSLEYTMQSGKLETESSELSKVGLCELEHVSKQTTEQHKENFKVTLSEICEKQIMSKETSQLWDEENILPHTSKSHEKEPNVNIISDTFAKENISNQVILDTFAGSVKKRYHSEEKTNKSKKCKHSCSTDDDDDDVTKNSSKLVPENSVENQMVQNNTTKSVSTVIRSTKSENYTIDALCKTVRECATSETLNNMVTVCSSSNGISSNTFSKGIDIPIVCVSNKHGSLENISIESNQAIKSVGGSIDNNKNNNDTDTSPKRVDKKCGVVAESKMSASPMLPTNDVKLQILNDTGTSYNVSNEKIDVSNTFEDKMVEQPSPQNILKNKPGSKHSTPILLSSNKDQNPPIILEKSVTVEFIAQPNEITEQKRNSQTKFSVNNQSDLCSSASHEILTSSTAVNINETPQFKDDRVVLPTTSSHIFYSHPNMSQAQHSINAIDNQTSFSLNNSTYTKRACSETIFETQDSKFLPILSPTTNISNAFPSGASISISQNSTFEPIHSSCANVSSKSNNNSNNNEVISTSLSLSLHNHELSNDIFASLQVPSGGQHPESISPTAAFLLAFPLVSSSKVSDVIADSQEDVENDSLQGPTTLLQIGNIDHYPSSNKVNCISLMPEEHQVTTASSNLSSSSSSSVNSVSTLVIKPLPEFSPSKLLFTKHQDKTSASLNKHSFNFPSHNAVSCAGTFQSSEAQPCENISDEWKKLKIPCSNYNENHSEKVNELDNIRNVGTQFQSNGLCEVKSAGSVTTAKATSAVSSQPLLDTSSLGSTSFTDSSTYPITSVLEVNLPKQDTVSFVSPVPAPKYQDCNNSAHLCTPTSTLGFHNNVKENVLQTLEINNLIPTSTCSKYSSITNSLNFTNQPTKDISMLCPFNEKEVSQGCKGLCGQSSNQVVDSQSINGSSSNYNDIQKNVETFAYKSSATSSSSDTFKYGCAHNFFNVKSDSTVYVTSATVTNPYKYFNSNDYSVVPSHTICPPTYTQATTCREQTKPPFPVAQNSSNSGILSSAGAVGHTSHCDVLQPLTMNMPQYTMSSNYTGQKSVSIPYTTNFNNSPSFTSTSNTILGNNIIKQKHEKNVSNTRKTLANSKKSDDQFSNSFFGPSCESQISHNFTQNTVQANLDVQQNNTSRKNDSICFDTFKVPPLLESKRQHSSHHRLQHRPPVNWMTTPDIRPNQNIPLVQPFGAHFTTSLNSVDSSQINKELEFCNATENGQNSLTSNSNIFSNFENRNFVNSSSFYSSNTCLQSNLYQNNTSRNKHSEPTTGQNEAQQNPSQLVSLDESQARPSGSWVQKKGVYSIASTSSDNMFVPSTLPTLVGDLALGTSCNMTTADEHHLNKSFANSNFSGNDHNEKLRMNTQIPGKQIKSRHDKTLVGKNKIDMLCTNEFSSNFLGTTSGTNHFLSVSQLVDSVKSRSGSSRVDVNKSHLSNKQVRQHKITSSGPKDNTAQNRGDVKNENKPFHIAQMDSTNGTICTSDTVARGMSNVQNIKDSSTRTNDQINLEYSPSTLLPVTDNIQWPSNSTNTSRKQTITGAHSFKTPASSYSAEALIGLNSHQNSKNSDIIQNDAAHKVISLPPPVVSDRFAHQHNYHNHSQISAPATYNNDTTISNNYIAPASLNLPISQSQNINYQFSVNHNNFSCSPQQNQQLYTNSTLRYSSSAHTVHPQGSKIYPSSNFAHNVHHTNTGMAPVSMSSGFLPDISGSNNFLAPPNTASSFTLPPLVVAKGSKINTYNMIYSNPPVSVSSSQQLHGNLQHASRNETSHSISDHNIVKTNQNSSSDQNKRSLIPSQNHNLNSINNNNCSTGKQRSRRRGTEPIVSSTSGFNNFVDLGYLTMPPGIGSPMLTDDGMYINHTTNFLPVSQSGTASMYPSASSNTHGTFYSPPRPPSCATTHLSVSRTLQQSTASPNAANTSGTTLANFNLSTIFPEIIDKQSSSVPSSVYSSSSKNPLPSTHSNLPHSSTMEMPRENEFLHHSRVQPVALSNTLGQTGRKQWP